MRNINLFQYLAAFITIVLALAISDMVMSAHRLVMARARVKWDALALLAAVYVFLMVLSEFFSLWGNADVAYVPFFYLVLLVVVSGVAAMAAFTVLPDSVPEGSFDLRVYYDDNRRYLWLMLSLALIGDLLRYFFLEYLTTNAFPPWGGDFWFSQVPLELGIVGGYLVLAFVADRRIQAVALALSYALALNNFAAWSVR